MISHWVPLPEAGAPAMISLGAERPPPSDEEESAEMPRDSAHLDREAILFLAEDAWRVRRGC